MFTESLGNSNTHIVTKRAKSLMPTGDSKKRALLDPRRRLLILTKRPYPLDSSRMALVPKRTKSPIATS